MPHIVQRNKPVEYIPSIETSLKMFRQTAEDIGTVATHPDETVLSVSVYVNKIREDHTGGLKPILAIAVNNDDLQDALDCMPANLPVHRSEHNTKQTLLAVKGGENIIALLDSFQARTRDENPETLRVLSPSMLAKLQSKIGHELKPAEFVM